MPNELMIILYFVMWYLLITMALLFVLSGIDDLFIDGYFWIRYVKRKWNAKRYPPLTYEKLIAKPEQFIAVLVPCWHEANVIGTMLMHNCYSIDYKQYYIFVGVYPNDPETVAEVQRVASVIPQVQCVIGASPGPTNKAANLNGMYQHVKEFEKTLSSPFEIFVFHDSEDVIHPLSFRLYNYLIPRKEMIQIPVFPLAVSYWNFTHWLYADEFSELHTKDIAVREAMGGHVPSAGVGTAFARNALMLLENPVSNTPFSADSLTEDYRISLMIRVRDLKQIFVSREIVRTQWHKRRFSSGYYQKTVKEFVATRALFPQEYYKAVKQKARWIIGIVFQEWEHSKWPDDWRIRYTLAHDRKSSFTHFINGFGYFVFFFWLFYTILTYLHPEYPSLQERLNMHKHVWWLMDFVFLMMLERLLQRVIAVRKVYGWIPALLSIPRAAYGNLLNLHALIRAYNIYYRTPKTSAAKKQPAWDKTEHQFPGSHTLTSYHRRLGDLLIEKKLITREQLRQGMIEQQKTGERLGQVLCRLDFITESDLRQQIAEQYGIDLFPCKRLESAKLHCEVKLKKRTNRWLNKHGAIPVSLNKRSNTLTVAIDDPTNELLLKNTMARLAPRRVQFVLIDAA